VENRSFGSIYSKILRVILDKFLNKPLHRRIKWNVSRR